MKNSQGKGAQDDQTDDVEEHITDVVHIEGSRVLTIFGVFVLAEGYADRDEDDHDGEDCHPIHLNNHSRRHITKLRLGRQSAGSLQV